MIDTLLAVDLGKSYAFGRLLLVGSYPVTFGPLHVQRPQLRIYCTVSSIYQLLNQNQSCWRAEEIPHMLQICTLLHRPPPTHHALYKISLNNFWDTQMAQTKVMNAKAFMNVCNCISKV